MTRRSKHPHNNAFTLTELVVVIAIAGIITLGIGVLLANSQKSWGQLFNRVYGDSASDSFVIQRAFDTVCRKASTRKYDLSDSGDRIQLYYWDSGSTAATPENYARFYQSENDVLVEYGQLQTGTWQPDTGQSTTTVTLASNIDSLKFTVEGTSIQMFLTYLDNDLLPVVCSSVRHNY